MDDDKNIIEKAIEAVKDIAHSASEAAKHALEPEPIKPGEEVLMLAPEGGSLLGEAPMPQYVVLPRKKSRKASKKTPDMSGRITPTYDFPAPTSKMPAKKKTAKKTAKKPAKKSAKKTKSAVKKKKTKTPRRTVKKKKKAKRG
jgi:hypothetical protein